jgi:hypothetical protein
VWNEITLKLNWSNNTPDDLTEVTNHLDYGFMSIWLNNVPVVVDYIPGITDGVYNYHCHLDETVEIDNASNFYFSNILAGAMERNMAVKFGHYRGNRTEDATMYFDDFKMTNIFPDNRTKLKDEHCDIILPYDYENTVLDVYEIPGATEYVARFVEFDGTEHYKGMGLSTTMILKWYSFLEAEKTYDVSVRAKGVLNTGYGDTCSVTIGNFSKLEKRMNNSNDSSQIFPNPFTEEIDLSLYKNISAVNIYNNSGKLVYGILNPKKPKINLSFLVDGMYNIQIISDEKMINEKIIKKST